MNENSLPNGWELVTLRDILSKLESGRRPKGGVGGIDRGILSIGGEHVSWDGTLNLSSPKYIDIGFFNSMKSGILQDDDILIVKDGATTGKVAHIDQIATNQPMAVNEHVFICRINKKKVISKFVFYHLKSKKGLKQILNSYHGAAQGGINSTFVDNYLLPLPPLETQQKIVAILEKAEEIKRLRADANAQTQKLIQSVFLDMFGDPNVNANHWKIKKLGDIAEKIQDGSHFSPKDQNGTIPYVTAKNIRPWGIDLGDITYVSEDFHKSIYSRCDPRKGDVIYIKDGATAGLAKVNTLDMEFSMLSSIALIRPKIDLMDSYFIEYYLNHPSIKRKILERKSGSAITRLILREIKEIPIIVPPYDLQSKFGKIATNYESLFQGKMCIDEELEKLCNQLNVNAFSGELVA